MIVPSPYETFAAKSGAVQLPPKPSADLGRPLSEFQRHTPGDPDELLKNRYLCRGSGLLLVGPTGVGKSSLAIQGAILWAIGRPAFGIEPAQPLKSLIVQAENDDGDIAEMRDGVIAGLDLSEEETALALANVVVAKEDTRTGKAFFAQCQVLLENHRPDLLWIDPALAYLNGETINQSDVGSFLRHGLNPLLRNFNCGGVVITHTNKPPREKPAWNAMDFAYSATGSAEWANWARAILVLQNTPSQNTFVLQAAKRGQRLKWTETDGATIAYRKYIAHTEMPGIYWREVDQDEKPAGQDRKPKTIDDLLAYVPKDTPIIKTTLIENCKQGGIGNPTARALLDEALQSKYLYLWKEKRTGTNPLQSIARFPQPTPPG